MKPKPKPKVPTQGARFADLIARTFSTEKQNEAPGENDEEARENGEKKNT